MDEHLTEAGIASDKDTPLFRTVAGRTGALTEGRMTRTDALRMIWRRARAAGIKTEIGYHRFMRPGSPSISRTAASSSTRSRWPAHESARTTKLYDDKMIELRWMRWSGLFYNVPFNLSVPTEAECSAI